MSRTTLTLLLIAIYILISFIGVYYKLKIDGEKHPIDFFFSNFKIWRRYIGGHWYKIQLLNNNNPYNVAIPTQKAWVRIDDMPFLTLKKIKYYVIQENDF